MTDGEWANETNRESLEYDWIKYQQQVADERENWERRFQLESQQQMKMLGEQAATDVNVWKQTQSPQAIVKAAQDAGLNPAVILGKTGGTPSITPAALPNPSTSYAPGGSPGMVGYNQQDPFLQLSEIVQGLSEMSRSGVDAYSSLKQLPSIIGNRLADTSFKEAQKEYADMVNVTYRAFGSKQAAANFLKTFNEGILAKVQGDTEKARKLWYDAQRELFGVETDTAKAELPYVATKMVSVINNLDSATEANKAAAQDSRSHVAVNQQNAKVQEQQAKLLKWQNFIQRSEPAREALYAEYQAMRNAGKLSDEQLRQAKIATEGMIYANGNKEFTYWFDKFHTLMGDAVNAAEAFGRFRNTQELIDVGRSNAETNRIRLQNELDNPVFEEQSTQTYDQVGHPTTVTRSHRRPAYK